MNIIINKRWVFAAAITAAISLTYLARVRASSIISDTIFVGTVAGQRQPEGIAISSSVYFFSGSSLTLQGPNGYIKTSSSVTASAFYGDASHLNLTGPATLIDTQTFTGADTFTSSFTIQSNGRQIILSTDTNNNILAISGAGAITFSPTLHNSSSTVIPAAASTNANFGPCISGSTLTITTRGGRVELLLSGFLFNTVIMFVPAALSFLQDGQFANDLNSSKAIVRSQSSVEGAYDVGPFRYLLNAPSPGVHSYCLTLAAPGGGTTQLGGTGLPTTIFFYVNEIK